MTKAEYKKAIAKAYGFAANKVVLLEAGESNGVCNYAMFEVCGFQYKGNPSEGTLEMFVC